MDGLQYYYDNFGKYLFIYHVPSPKSIILNKPLLNIPRDCTSFLLPYRNYERKVVNGKKVADLKGSFEIATRRYSGGYIISNDGVKFYGKLELPDFDHIQFIDKNEDVSLMGEFAKWLVEEAKPPFMLGVIENASPNDSFKVSLSEEMCFLCEANKDNVFNLRLLRQDVELLKSLGGFNWKDFVKSYYLRQDFLDAAKREEVLPQYKKMLKENPKLSGVLQKLSLVSGSTAFDLTRAYFNSISQGDNND